MFVKLCVVVIKVKPHRPFRCGSLSVLVYVCFGMYDFKHNLGQKIFGKTKIKILFSKENVYC